MTQEEFGFWFTVGVLCVGAAFGWLLAYVFKVEWFRERLLSDNYWTRVVGMLPIAVPLYIIAGLINAAFNS